MLSLTRDNQTGQPRLIIRNPFVAAWIDCYRRLDDDFQPHETMHDWRLWVQRAPHLLPQAGKSPTRLLIESRLRAWLLQRFHRKLRDLRFEELCAIAAAAKKHPTRGQV
jgi:hypothetical protein